MWIGSREGKVNPVYSLAGSCPLFSYFRMLHEHPFREEKKRLDALLRIQAQLRGKGPLTHAPFRKACHDVRPVSVRAKN